MRYPTILIPTTTEVIIRSDIRVEIPKVTPLYSRWAGIPPTDTKGKGLASILDYNGRYAFAELIILWTFLKEGWDGVWIDNYPSNSPKYRRDYWGASPIPELPAAPVKLLREIGKGREFVPGTWDVFCWRESDVLFVESKQNKKGQKDKLSPKQIEWVMRSLECGLEPKNFLVVEWQCTNT